MSDVTRFSGGGFGITGSPSSGWTFNKTADGTAETVVTMTVSDDAAASLAVVNWISSTGTFVPAIRGTGPASAAASRFALVLSGRITATYDSGTTPAVVFDARVGTSAAVATRPLFSFQNAGTEVAQITPAGGIRIQGGTTPSLIVGASGTAITQLRVYSQALDPASVAANTTAEQTFTVTGLTTADKVFVNKPTNTAGLGIANARVSAADTLAITFGNFTGAPIDAASETYTITAIRS